MECHREDSCQSIIFTNRERDNDRRLRNHAPAVGMQTAGQVSVVLQERLDAVKSVRYFLAIWRCKPQSRQLFVRERRPDNRVLHGPYLARSSAMVSLNGRPGPEASEASISSLVTFLNAHS